MGRSMSGLLMKGIGGREMKVKSVTVNILLVVIVPFLLWLGATGRVSWWMLLALVIWGLKVDVTFKL